MSLFITFEGGEGCGKSTQSKAFYRNVLKLAAPAILIHEPGSTPLGERVRFLLKRSNEVPISPLTELMLFNAARSQLVHEVINPRLKEGKIVICDRFADSTVAYQHYGRGINFELVTEVNRAACQGVKPDTTFLLDIRPEMGLARKRSGVQDRFEQEDLAFHQRVREGFLKLADGEPRRWVIIDASQSKSHIAALIWDKMRALNYL